MPWSIIDPEELLSTDLDDIASCTTKISLAMSSCPTKSNNTYNIQDSVTPAKFDHPLNHWEDP